MHTNQFGQFTGAPLQWIPKAKPAHVCLQGVYCHVVPFNVASHAKELFEVLAIDNQGESWTYLPYGPFATLADFTEWLLEKRAEPDTLLYAILESKTFQVLGIAGYLRINPSHGVIEVGHLHFSTLLKQTPAATEAMYLMMQWAIEECGYRRYEWKCNALNQASREAAERLGFTFEGIFRQSNVFKNYNRDTAWFSILDSEWPRLKQKFQHWLDPSNFDARGKQILKLKDC